jgi:hypothetical protein
MKSFGDREDLSLYKISIVSEFILDGEALSEGEDFLFDIKLHKC